MIHCETGLTLAYVTFQMSWRIDAYHVYEFLFEDIKDEQMVRPRLIFLLPNARDEVYVFFVVKTKLESKMNVIFLLRLLVLQKVLISHFLSEFLKQGFFGNFRVLDFFVLCI